MRIAIIIASLLLMAAPLRAGRIAGGDISLLPEYEKAGAIYKSGTGSTIPDLVTYMHQEGMNVVRVRLFVDPSAYHGSDADPNACQNLDYIIPLCKRVKDAGLSLMLDFHYSDFWADPAKQYTPAAWASLSDEELYTTIYEYTRDVLTTLTDEGAAPDYIQTGNEISYGMLWGPEGTPESQKLKCTSGSENNWPRFTTLLRRAGRACREVCPQAKIVIHTERVANVAVLSHFYKQMDKYSVDYDIIGLSYYPYFHGDLTVLGKALDNLAGSQPDKPVMIVETGYSYKWEVPGSSHDFTSQWPLSAAGQNQFITDMIALLDTYPAVEGVIWWWPEYNAFHTSLSGWYNAPLFDSTTGRATPAFYTLAGYPSTAGIEGVLTPDDYCKGMWHDLSGRPVAEPLPHGIYVRRGEKMIVR